MAGLSILRKLLLREAAKQSGERSGIAQIGNVTRDIAEKKFQAFVLGAKRQGVDLDKYTEQELKYIIELNKPKSPRVISADSPEGRGITQGLINALDRDLGKNVIKADFGKPFADEVKKDKTKGLEQVAKTLEADQKRKLNTFKNLDDKKKLNDDEYEEFLEEIGGEDRLEAYDFDGTAGSAKRILKEDVEYEQSMFDQYKKGKLDPEPKPASSLDREVKEAYDQAVREGRLQNIRLKDGRRIESEDDFREYIDELNEDNNFANGGRIGLKTGMSKRAFLKLMGGAAAGIGALKTGALKLFGKEGAKKVATDVVTTPPVAGKPAWFDSLVNKVIREGDDVSKNFATKEREIVHIKKIDEDSTVTVTQDLDEGIVRVEYDSADNVFGDTVQLQYKKPLPDEVNPNPQAEFTTAESGPVGRQVGPDDYDIDVDEVGGTSIKDLDSDVSKLKEYATGQKPTLKEIVQNKKRKDKAQRITDDPEEQSDAVVRRQGEMLDYDGPDDDFASGGRVGLLSGGGVIRVMLKKLAERYGKKPSELLAVTNYKSLPVEVKKFLTKEQFELIKKDMRASRVEQFENLRDMVKNRQEFDRSAEALKKMGMDISDTMLPLMNKAVTPGGTTPDDLLMMEQIIKNLQMKDRKLNASGGLAGMLGE